jgi:hypothetical protein
VVGVSRSIERTTSRYAAHGYHAADAFVAQGNGRERKSFQTRYEQVRVAQAASFHAQQDFGGTRRSQVQRFDTNGAARFGQYSGLCVKGAHTVQ